MSWAAQALTAVRRGEALAMVTVVAAEGSTPREAGARMLVGERAQSGTIGGGALEHRATDQARRMLASERGWALQDYPLGPFLRQCCGGHVRLLLERLDGGSAGWLGEAARLETAGERYALKARVQGGQLQRIILPHLGEGDQPKAGGGGDAGGSRKAATPPNQTLPTDAQPRIPLHHASHGPLPQEGEDWINGPAP